MMYYYNSFIPFHMFGFGHFFMLLFWGLVIYGIILLFKNNKSNEKDNSLNILKERYAKGEITKEQFEKMKKDLQ